MSVFQSVVVASRYIPCLMGCMESKKFIGDRTKLRNEVQRVDGSENLGRARQYEVVLC